MSEASDKGKITAEIGADVISEALRSVEKHQGGGDVPVEVETGSAPNDARVGELEKEVEQLKAQLEFSQAKGRELMEKLKDGHEKMLRAVADLDNFKKRAAKEKDEVQRFGIEKLLKDFLPVADNLDRALGHAGQAADFEGFKTGVAMTRKLFEDALGKHGLKGFSAAGKAFDPHRHEAMSQVETDELPPNQVYQEVLKGYALHDRLVRPALVVVSKAKPAAAPNVGNHTERTAADAAGSASNPNAAGGPELASDAGSKNP